MRSSKSLITFFNTPSPDLHRETESPSKNLPLCPTETCLQLASHENISSFSLLLRSLNELPETDTYLIPFLLTQSLFKHFAGLYLSTATKHIDATHVLQTSKVPFSSCTDNAAGLLCLFAGIKKSQYWNNLANLGITANMEIPIPSKSVFSFIISIFMKSTFKFEIVDLLKGEAMGQLQTEEDIYTNHDPEHIQTQLIKHLSHSLNRYTEHVGTQKSPGENTETSNEGFIAQYIEHAVKYEFNAGTITALKIQIQMNTSKTSTMQSFIYYIRAFEAGRKGVHHAFLLEQFFHPTTNSDRFRLYQTWIHDSDLSRSISQQLMPLAHQSWTLEEAMAFMNKLMLIYSSDDGIRISEFECFGLGNNTINTKRDPFFEENKLVGRFVEYYCLPFNPRDCVAQLREIAEPVAELKMRML